MLDILFIRKNSNIVKTAIRNRFAREKLPLVDEVIDLDDRIKTIANEARELWIQQYMINWEIRMKTGQNPTEVAVAEVEELKEQLRDTSQKLEEKEKLKKELEDAFSEKMLLIPNIVDSSVPYGQDENSNAVVGRFGYPTVLPDEISDDTDIGTVADDIDKIAAELASDDTDNCRMDDNANLYPSIMSYIRDFMSANEGLINWFSMTRIPADQEGVERKPTDVLSYAVDNKIMERVLNEYRLPKTLAGCLQCCRQRKDVKGDCEQEVCQTEKQEIAVVCKPEDSISWYSRLCKLSVDLFRSMDVPIRRVECCTGTLDDLEARSGKIEVWLPKERKYVDVCSCSYYSDAQARRLNILVEKKEGKNYVPHTLNCTIAFSPHVMMAFLQNHLQADGSIEIPGVLWPYTGKKVILPKQYTET